MKHIFSIRVVAVVLVLFCLVCLSTTGYSEALDRDGTEQKDSDSKHVALNDITVKRDVVYKKTKQGPLHLDLYYPDGPQPGIKCPIVIYTHGGGWNKGDRRIGETGTKRELVVALNEAGFCVASVEYRLCLMEGIRMRDCVIDSKDAIRYLARHAEKFFIDANRVCTIGDSAGGHIAQMLLLSPPDSFVGDPELAHATFRMAAGVSWYGPCDFEKTDLFRRDGEAEVRDRFGNRILRGNETPEQKLTAYREVSPVNYLKVDSPPLVMLQGDKDPVIPVHHAYYMKERAEAVNAPVRMLIVENSSHGWNERGGKIGLTVHEIVEKTVAFLKESTLSCSLTEGS